MTRLLIACLILMAPDMLRATPEWTVRLIDERADPVGRPDKDWRDPVRTATVAKLREAAITSILYNDLRKPGKITQEAYVTARNAVNATDYGSVVGERACRFAIVPIGRPDLYLRITYFDDAVARNSGKKPHCP